MATYVSSGDVTGCCVLCTAVERECCAQPLKTTAHRQSNSKLARNQPSWEHRSAPGSLCFSLGTFDPNSMKECLSGFCCMLEYKMYNLSFKKNKEHYL
jgi:hypothetical protein